MVSARSAQCCAGPHTCSQEALETRGYFLSPRKFSLAGSPCIQGGVHPNSIARGGSCRQQTGAVSVRGVLVRGEGAVGRAPGHRLPSRTELRPGVRGLGQAIPEPSLAPTACPPPHPQPLASLMGIPELVQDAAPGPASRTGTSDKWSSCLPGQRPPGPACVCP